MKPLTPHTHCFVSYSGEAQQCTGELQRVISICWEWWPLLVVPALSGPSRRSTGLGQTLGSIVTLEKQKAK